MLHEKVRWPRAARILLLALLLSVFVPTVLSQWSALGWATLLVLVAAFVAFGWLIWTFTTLSIRIDAQSLHIGYGPFQEHITLEHIVACDTIHYRWQEWGGFGLRMHREGKLYNIPGDNGVAVQLRLDNGDLLLFSSRDPDGVCRMLHLHLSPR
jgi:hypothetical protein